MEMTIDDLNKLDINHWYVGDLGKEYTINNRPPVRYVKMKCTAIDFHTKTACFVDMPDDPHNNLSWSSDWFVSIEPYDETYNKLSDVDRLNVYTTESINGHEEQVYRKADVMPLLKELEEWRAGIRKVSNKPVDNDEMVIDSAPMKDDTYVYGKTYKCWLRGEDSCDPIQCKCIYSRKNKCAFQDLWNCSKVYLLSEFALVRPLDEENQK